MRIRHDEKYIQLPQLLHLPNVSPVGCSHLLATTLSSSANTGVLTFYGVDNFVFFGWMAKSGNAESHRGSILNIFGHPSILFSIGAVSQTRSGILFNCEQR